MLIKDAFDQLQELLKSKIKYDLSFGLQYSSIIDWVADITPRRNHPRAKDYPLWQAGGSSASEAILNAIKLAQSAIADYEDETQHFERPEPTLETNP